MRTDLLSWHCSWQTHWLIMSIKRSFWSHKLLLFLVISWVRSWKVDIMSMSVHGRLSNRIRKLTFYWIVVGFWVLNRRSFSLNVFRSFDINMSMLLLMSRIWCGMTLEVDGWSLPRVLDLWSVQTDVGVVRPGRWAVLLVHIK